jgi:hypothetical protein
MFILLRRAAAATYPRVSSGCQIACISASNYLVIYRLSKRNVILGLGAAPRKMFFPKMQAKAFLDWTSFF